MKQHTMSTDYKSKIFASKNRKLRKKQVGASLVTVLIFLLLAIITVLGAFRASLLNEKMVGNESDYNRAFAAAEALIRDAEMDIRGRRPPYNFVQSDGNIGFPCRPTSDGSLTEITSKVGYENSCRLRNGATPWFPRGNDEFDDVEAIVIAGGGTNRCSAGICFPLNMTDLATIETQLISGNTIGVPYGSFTRTDTTSYGNLTDEKSNTFLSTTNVGSVSLIPKASTTSWYVVEAFRYGATISGSGMPHPATQMKPDPANSVVYRITAVVRGLRGTVVVLKSIFVPNPANQSP
jgi:type IV pilus assembly protein PilX